MALKTGRVCQLHSKWRFRVEIPSFSDVNFEKVSEISMEVEVEEYWDGGGDLLPDKFPGKGKVDNVTFERGATTNLDDLDWFKKVADFGAGTAAAACADFKQDVAVVQLDGKKDEIMRYTLFKMWPVKVTCGSWDSNAGAEKVVRSFEAAYDFPKVSSGSAGSAIGL